MTKYFKKSCKNNKSHQVNNDNNYSGITQNSSLNPDRYVHKHITPMTRFNEIMGQTQTFRGTKSEPEDTKDHHNFESPDSNFDSSSDSE